MKRTEIIAGMLSLAMLALAACGESGGPDGATKSEPSEPNVVMPETPAPLATAGKSFLYRFDGDAPNQMPAKFHAALTGQGAKGEWVVKADPTAPSEPNVLAQLSDDRTDYRFPLAIADEASFRDLELSVKFKAVSGKTDRAGGLVFRLKDANNYYVVRANALESNYRLYHVVGGASSSPARTSTSVPASGMSCASSVWATRSPATTTARRRSRRPTTRSKTLARWGCGRRPIR
jgi:hypothetical protein